MNKLNFCKDLSDKLFPIVEYICDNDRRHPILFWYLVPCIINFQRWLELIGEDDPARIECARRYFFKWI